jgi:hypothetical protein
MAGRKLFGGYNDINSLNRTTATPYDDVITAQNPWYYFQFDEVSGGGAFTTDPTISRGSEAFGSIAIGDNTTDYNGFRQPNNELVIGNPGSAFFDGTQYLETAAGEDDTFNSSFDQSMSFVFTPTTDGSIENGIVHVGGRAHGFHFSYFANRVIFYKTETNTTYVCRSEPIIRRGETYHVAGTAKNGDEMKLYINSELIQTQKIGTQTIFGSGSFRAGSHVGSPQLSELGTSADAEKSFKGSMSKLAVWDRVLSSSEVTAQYEAATGFTSATRFSPTDLDNLKVWHDVKQGEEQFDPNGASNIAGGNWNDYSGLGNDSVAFDSGTNAKWEYRQPRIDFRNSRFQNPTSYTQPFTVFLVAEWRQVDNFNFIIDSAGTNRVVFGTNNVPETYLFAGNNDVVVGPPPETDTPIIYSLVVDGANSFIYENGVEIASGDAGPNDISSGFEIGYNTGNSANWQGYLQEVLMYDDALTTNERQQVEGYLGYKYYLRDKLPQSHPYKGTRP